MVKVEQELKWISTLGGPLILMERSSTKDWRGNLEPLSSETKLSDYDRACSIEDYTGLIKVADSDALVLGDLPSETTCVQVNITAFLLVRWIWANDEEQVKKTLESLSLEQDWVDTETNLYFKQGDLLLFDSVYEGKSINDSLNIQVENGSYRVSTCSYQPNKEVNLFLILVDK